jgi:ABC-type bacteriocin/lantibiotic exporter with double-glycine peptidase domain
MRGTSVRARAIYRHPKILFLDEGTAHLDVEKERQINENLRGLKMTRVSVAHRPEITTSESSPVLQTDYSRIR